MVNFARKHYELNHLRPAAERIGDFHERYRTLTAGEGQVISQWCGDCRSTSCTTCIDQSLLSSPAFAKIAAKTSGCPLDNDIPNSEREVMSGNIRKAYQIASRTNPMLITGKLCPPFCETSCVQQEADHIRPIEELIGEHAWANGYVKPLVATGNLNKKVAIIGSGPGGFAMAEYLFIAGCNVTVFDRADMYGGLLTRGIPGFKLSNEKAYRHYRRHEEAGIAYKMNWNVGTDISFSALAENYDAIVIAMGTHSYQAIPSLQGLGERRVLQGIPYLITQNKRDDGLIPLDDEIHSGGGNRLAVIGGGDTGADMVGTLMRQFHEASKSMQSGGEPQKIFWLVRSGKYAALEKEVQANMQEAEALKHVLGYNPLQVIFNTVVQGGALENEQINLDLHDLREGSRSTTKVDRIVQCIGSNVPKLQDMFGLANVGQVEGGIIPVKQILPVEHVLDRSKRQGPGGGYVGTIEMKKNGRQVPVPVFAVGDVTIPRGSYMQPTVVWALAHGRYSAPEVAAFLQNPRIVQAPKILSLL